MQANPVPSPKSPLLLAVPLLLALLAGCAQPGDGPAPGAAPEAVPTGLALTGPAVGPDLTSTTATAPRLVEGEWWKIRFAGAFYTSNDLIRIVANATPDGYVFGMPHEGWIKEAIAYHSPAFGDVALDLSSMVHNENFGPLRFPLVAGDTWETSFAGPVIATVESADEYTAEIVLRPPSSNPTPEQMALGMLGVLPDLGEVRLTYDARVHEVVKMDSGIGSWEVIAHGYDFQGWVSVPSGHHTAIDYGVFGPDTDNPLPTRTVPVDERFNRITVMQAVFALSPGVYRLTSTSPDGQTFTTEVLGPPRMKMNLFEVSAPGGDWQQEDLVGGVGGTYTMGIAYEQYDILVPGGERRPTHGHEVMR